MTGQLSSLNEDSRLIPAYSGHLFFLPIDEVFRLINQPQLLKHAYEQNRKPNWFTWKTFRSVLHPLSSRGGVGERPSSKAKLQRIFDSAPALKPALDKAGKKDAFWPPYAGWLGFLSSHAVLNQCTRDYWLQWLEADWNLACKDIRKYSEPADRVRCLVRSEVADVVGNNLAIAELQSHIEALNAAESIDNSILYKSVYSSSLTALMRFAAWLVAEDVHAGSSVTAGSRPLEAFLPKLTGQAGSWTNPLVNWLDYMADNTGRSPATSAAAHLGQMWAEHELLSGSSRSRDVTHKQRLIRNWVSGEHGRPEMASMRALATAVMHKHKGKLGLASNELESDIDSLAVMGAFADTTHALRQALTAINASDEVVALTFDSYETEYDRALELLQVSTSQQPK